MTVSETAGPDGERDEPWLSEGEDAGTGAGVPDTASADDRLEIDPVELTEEAGRLDLDDDDPPLPWLQGDDDDEDFQGSGAGQTIGFVILGLLAIGLIVGGIWWVTQRSADRTLVADGSTIAAPKEPYKQRPENPGGKVFEGTGDTSFGISEGQKRPARLGEQGATPGPGFDSLDKGDKPADKGAPPAASASGKPAVVEPAGIGVQVAAYSNQEQAEAGWTRLSQQYSALAGAKHRIVQGQADIGTVYRLQAVAADVAAARELCGKLKAAGLNCQVKN